MHPTRRRPVVRVLLGVATAVAVTASVTPAAAAGSDPYRKPRPATQATASVEGTAARVRPVAPDAASTAASGSRPLSGRSWPAGARETLLLTGAAGTRRQATARTMPVTVGPPGKPAALPVGAPSAVTVEALPLTLAEAAGLTGVALRLSGVDSRVRAGAVRLSVDLTDLGSRFGGDWASRARVLQMPSCFATTPGRQACQRGAELPTSYDARTAEVSADVSLARSSSPAGGATLMVSAGPSGGAGSYAATGLPPGPTGSSAGSTGDFTSSQALRVPPALNGPGPSLAVSYSSGSVDGRTASTNPQPSWVGEGHSLEPGYVERRYVPCSQDMSGGNNTVRTGDLCWKTDNALLVLGGRSGELVRAADGSWRLEDDDGSRMVRLTGASNADDDTEYWQLTTTDGTRYVFGRGKRSDADTGPDTGSTLTVPVFGNDPGEPCYTASYATSSCDQAWRWNLDSVIDRHGSTTVYYYTRESNRYGRNLNSAVSAYDRAAVLDRIEYGQRTGTEHTSSAPARVVFDVAERCLPSGAVTCDPAQLTAANASSWPDVPFDQICDSTTSCPDRLTPTFFTRKRLTAVTTQVLRGNAYSDVDRYDFVQTFPSPGDGASARLWLASIAHTGKVGGDAALAPVRFSGIALPNRVEGPDAPPLVRWRVSQVVNETGGSVSVTYAAPECAAGSLPSAPHTNTKRCFPQYDSTDASVQTLSWFHRYPVTSLVEDDRTGGSPAKVTAYEYVGGPAYAFDDDDLVPESRRTWTRYRGYGTVRVRTGAAPDQRTLTETLYLRGMDGDRLPGGSTRQVSVTDSTGTALQDRRRLRGYVREQITYDGDGGPVVRATVNDPWISAPTAGSPTRDATLLGTGATRTRTPLAAGGVRSTATATTFDQYGMPVAVDDLGDTTTSADDRCERTTYIRNTAIWLLDPVQRRWSTAGSCTVAPGATLDDVRTSHDGLAHGATPTRGDVTHTEVLSDSPAGPVYTTRSRTTYDADGRTLTTQDALGGVSRTAYTPASGGPVTAVTTTNALQHSVVSTLDPAWGWQVAEVDANGKRTDIGRDPLGRVTAVWLPGRARATQTAHVTYGYLWRTDGPSVVTTRELENNGTYSASKQLYDGLLRPRQTQRPAQGGGRLLFDTGYDSRGFSVDRNGPTFNSADPDDQLLLVADNQITAQTRTTYDGAGRPTVAAFRVNGAEKWRTTTRYGGDRVTTVPPTGAFPSTSVSDARGRTTALLQYPTAGTAGAADTTTYTYTGRDELASVRDPAGNTWRYGYDLRGRQVRSVDPDRGQTDTTYDDLDQPLTVTDGRRRTIGYTYDALGRRTSARDGSATGPVRARWAYDRLANGAVFRGKPASHTRYVGSTATADGTPYTVAVSGYDDRGRSLGSTVTIPAAEGGLAGAYSSTVSYNVDGGIRSRGLPAAPGLSGETLRYGYDSLGAPTTFGGLASYVAATRYSPYGEVLQYHMGTTLGKASWDTRFYEEGTRRLSRLAVDRENISPTDGDFRYTYDPAGNLRSIVDKPLGGTADAQCFTYDHLARLKQAWTGTDDCAAAPALSRVGGPAPYWHTYDYDVTGNRTRLVEHASTGDVTTTSTYPAAGAARPHALQSTTRVGPSGTAVSTYAYDASGNRTTRTTAGSPGQTLTWDAEGNVDSITGSAGTTTLLHTADGERLLRRDPAGTTLYLDDTEVVLTRARSRSVRPYPSRTFTTGAQTITSTRFYRLDGETIALRKASGVTTLISDRHGTTELAIANRDNTLVRRRSLPFGGGRGPTVSWPSTKGFLGGTRDPTGLVHLGDRLYDPTTGQFLSPDRVVDHGRPQQVNGYAYAVEPATVTDPLGAHGTRP